MERRRPCEIPPQSQRVRALRLLRAALATGERRQQSLWDESAREMTRAMLVTTDTAGPTDAGKFYFQYVRDRRSEGRSVLLYRERRGAGR